MNLYDVLQELINVAAVPPALAADMQKVVHEARQINALGSPDCSSEPVMVPVVKALTMKTAE